MAEWWQMLTSLAFPATAGVNTSRAPVFFDPKLSGQFIQLAGNLRIKDGRFRTRHRVVEMAVTGDAVDDWKSRHTQSALWYSPQSGQGSHYLGVGPGRLIETAGGRLYELREEGFGLKVSDISGGMQADETRPLAYLCQGENYVIRTDGVSPTMIYDGKATFGSAGYNQLAKEAARFPNAAGPVLYAAGRFWVVLFGRRVYASDALHQTNQSTAEDLLRFTDQTYDFQNVYFAPPADCGDITGLFVTVSSGFDNSRAQGEVMVNCANSALWGIQLGVPRAQWASSPMRHMRSVETGAAGHLAFSVRDGDVLMRTPRGIESLNLLARERQTLGSAAIDLGAELRNLISYDHEGSLTYCSMINPLRWNRLFCTTAPIVDGLRRWHLGWVTANWNPMSERAPRSYAWEGVSMLPREIGRVIQFVQFRESSSSRVMAVVDKDDGASKGVVEFTQEDGDDMLGDGSTKPVDWYLMTRCLMTGGPYATSHFKDLRLFLDDIRTDVRVEVFVRSDKKRSFELFRWIDVSVVDEDGNPSISPQGSDRSFSMGNPFVNDQNTRWVQILVKGRGVTSIDLAIDADPGSSSVSGVDAECELVENDDTCGFDPYYPTK